MQRKGDRGEALGDEMKRQIQGSLFAVETLHHSQHTPVKREKKDVLSRSLTAKSAAVQSNARHAFGVCPSLGNRSAKTIEKRT